MVLRLSTILLVKREHQKILERIFARPASSAIPWRDIEALLIALGAEVSQREGSRVGVKLFGEMCVFHRPHPSPNTDKGALASVRKWLHDHGITP